MAHVCMCVCVHSFLVMPASCHGVKLTGTILIHASSHKTKPYFVLTLDVSLPHSQDWVATQSFAHGSKGWDSTYYTKICWLAALQATYM